MNLHFANIPEHNSWILSTLYRGRKYNGDSMSPTEEITYTSEPVDVFIRLDLDEQNKEYGFFENVTDTTVLDMSHLELSNSKMVQFPSGLYSTYYTLYAYPEVAAFNSNSYMVELISEVEQEEQVFFPSQLFSGNRTRFSWKEEEDSYQSKTIVNYGAFPDEYSVFIGDLEVMQKEIDEFEINYSGDFDIAMSSWRAPIDDNYLFWFYYAPTDLSSFQLPELPDSFRQVYPSYHNDSLELSMVKLKKYSNFSSYDDYLDGRSKSELIDESTEIHELNNYLYLHKESAVKVNLKLLETLEDPFSQDIY